MQCQKKVRDVIAGNVSVYITCMSLLGGFDADSPRHCHGQARGNNSVACHQHYVHTYINIYMYNVTCPWYGWMKRATVKSCYTKQQQLLDNFDIDSWQYYFNQQLQKVTSHPVECPLPIVKTWRTSASVFFCASSRAFAVGFGNSLVPAASFLVLIPDQIVNKRDMQSIRHVPKNPPSPQTFDDCTSLVAWARVDYLL